MFVNSGTTPDFIFAFTAPSGATAIRGAESYLSSGMMDAVNALTSAGTYATDATDEMFRTDGRLVMSTTGGQFTLQWAQAVSNAGATKVLKGSYLQLYES